MIMGGFEDGWVGGWCLRWTGGVVVFWGVGGIGRGLRVMGVMGVALGRGGGEIGVGVGLVEMVGVEGGLEDVVGCVLLVIIKGQEETKASTT